MSFVVKVLNVFDNRDIEAVADLCYEDFVHVDDYSMTTRDEWLASDKNQFENDCLHFTRDRSVVADRRDMFAMEFTRDIDGVTYRITNAPIKKDGKFWWFQINRVPI